MENITSFTKLEASAVEPLRTKLCSFLSYLDEIFNFFQKAYAFIGFVPLFCIALLFIIVTFLRKDLRELLKYIYSMNNKKRFILYASIILLIIGISNLIFPQAIFYSLIGAVVGSAIGGLIVLKVQIKYSEKRIKEKGRYSVRYIAHLSLKNMTVLPTMVKEFEGFEFKMTKLKEFLTQFNDREESKSISISDCRHYFIQNKEKLGSFGKNNSFLEKVTISNIFAPLMRQNPIAIPNADVVSDLLYLENEQTKDTISFIIDSLNQLSNNIASVNQLIEQIDRMINSILLEEFKDENCKLSKSYSYLIFNISKLLSADIASAFMNAYIVYKELFKICEIIGFNKSEISTSNSESLEKCWKFVTEEYHDNQHLVSYKNYLKIQEG